MPRPVKPTGRPLALVLAVALLLGACTGGAGDARPDGDGNGPTGRGTGETGPEPVGVSGTATGTATYEYVNAGLRVVMEIDGNIGTMRVDNGTDHQLGRPGFYLLDARTGRQVDGRVGSAARIAPGDTAAFDVQFSDIEIRNIGMVVLLFGRDNYGGFVRTA